MTPAEYAALRERVEDAEGEAANCSDSDCSCKRAAADLRSELEETVPCKICGGWLGKEDEAIPVYADSAGERVSGWIHSAVDCSE